MTTLTAGPHTWIRDVCRQFSDASGWELRFLPAVPGKVEDVESRLRSDPESCWFTEINDGQTPVGFLQLLMPADVRNRQSLSSVGDLADAFAQLIGRLATAGRLVESRTDEVTTLVDLSRSVPTEENLVQAIDRLLQGAIHLTSFRASAFFLLDPSTERLKLRARAQREPHTIPAAARSLAENPPDLGALLRRRIVLGGDDLNQSAHWLPPGTATAVCLAVESDSGPIGTLWVYDRRRREPSDREIHVLESISVQIASLLERVVLLRESEAQHRLQRDLQIASQCQAFDIVTSLAPEAGIEVAVRSTSRFEIGGDLCELISVEDGRTVVSIGDASGHGVSASIVMSAVRGAVRALGLDPRTILPAEGVLERVNRALYSITPAHQFMSLLYGVIDPRQRVFTYSNAGHPSPLLMREGGSIPLDSHGMLLGVVPDVTYGASVLPLTTGDTLIAFTDGVSEAMNGKRKMFRSDGIIEALQCNQGATPHVILEAIWSQLDAHLDGSAGHDDRSLMVIRVK
jgi:sigma-B regulation protein RsbU (phosphoserine phosphatase)